MKKIVSILLSLSLMYCNSQPKKKIKPVTQPVKMNIDKNLEVATFAGGCFWCTEAVFLQMKGVKTVASGYLGGTVDNPTYEEVCSGNTGHAEAIEILFDPKIITFSDLLEVFFATHDPTTLNRQGNDSGTQYRSEVFYHNKVQKQTTINYVKQMTSAMTFDSPIVTAVSPAPKFYVAENYHQNYYNQNKDQSYCHYVITPKVEKVKHLFTKKLK